MAIWAMVQQHFQRAWSTVPLNLTAPLDDGDDGADYESRLGLSDARRRVQSL
eukprot:CAMPEP_0119202594 /NCGR_PEP_ID=MMETSP1316-20130426/32406_1 /TAXON_ID=41880 /ORGANISM="Pycnococcus provasolii, Strain RCC2336" /LENGTH=51 /DNA_ID=CAMNT_0007198801 /DNA_START=209 /DNA_END=361 /DNA_ORIENTATION=+